jgi:hypothetical protein
MAEAAGDIFGPVNAETGDTTQWSSTVVDAGMTFDAHADATNNGSYGFRCLSDGAHNDAKGVKTFTEQTEMYVRGYFYIDPDVSVASGDMNYMFNLYDGGVILATVGVRRSTAGAGPWEFWRITSDIVGLASIATNFSLGEWHYIEIHFKAGTGANGGWSASVDGDEIFTTDFNDNFSAYAADTVVAGIYASTPANGDYIYVDDLKGSTSPIGAYAEEGGTANYIPAIYHYQRMRVA